jgi:hypothetical protein
MGFHRDQTGRSLHEPSLFKITNTTGSTLVRGTVVKRTGYNGTMLVAISTNPVADNRLGVVLDDILDGEVGYVGSQGDFGQFDTSSFTAEDIIYSTVSGGLSTTVLGDPIATVLTVNATSGRLLLYVDLPGIGSSSGSVSFNSYTVALTPTDVANGFITLVASPTSPLETMLMYEGAASQIYGIDFTVSGSTLTFTGLLPDIASGESVTIIYK